MSYQARTKLIVLLLHLPTPTYTYLSCHLTYVHLKPVPQSRNNLPFNALGRVQHVNQIHIGLASKVGIIKMFRTEQITVSKYIVQYFVRVHRGRVGKNALGMCLVTVACQALKIRPN